MIAARYHRVAQGRQARVVIKEHRLDGGPGSGPRKGGGSAKKGGVSHVKGGEDVQPSSSPQSTAGSTGMTSAKTSYAVKKATAFTKTKGGESHVKGGENVGTSSSAAAKAVKSPAPASYGKISTKTLTAKQAEYQAKVRAATPGSPEHAKASLKLGRIDGELAHRSGAKVESSAKAQAAAPKVEHAVLAASAAAKQSEAQAAIANGDYKTAIAKTKEAAGLFKKATAEALATKPTLTKESVEAGLLKSGHTTARTKEKISAIAEQQKQLRAVVNVEKARGNHDAVEIASNKIASLAQMESALKSADAKLLSTKSPKSTDEFTASVHSALAAIPPWQQLIVTGGADHGPVVDSFGESKVFVHAVREKLGMDKQTFATWAMKAHQEGKIEMSRFDLVGAANRPTAYRIMEETISGSPSNPKMGNTDTIGATFNFINRPRH